MGDDPFASHDDPYSEDLPPPPPEPTALDPYMPAIKMLACAVAVLIAYKFISSVKPKEEKENPFSAPKKKKAERPNYLYRLARASEPVRDAKGELPNTEPDEGDLRKKDKFPVETIGSQAAHQASIPVEVRMMAGGYFGNPEALDSKCLHLSTADQVPGTCKLYFKGVDDLILLKFSRAEIEKDDSIDLRWEEAQPKPGMVPRKGDFPHIYSPYGLPGQRLSYWALRACIPLPLSPDGESRIFPEDCFSEEIIDVQPANSFGFQQK